MPNLHNDITDITGISVGHAQHDTALTGCTVILCPKGAVAGVDQRGGAPGTRETDLLRPMHLVNKVHAVLLSGGSAFGLDASAGVMKYLEEKKSGFNTGVARVPIVPAAVIFDLAIGDPKVRPDAAMGYQACIQASTQRLAQGNVGAGCGASVGKLFGMAGATKTGIGSATVDAGGGILISALVVVNAFGDVVDPTSGNILAGTRKVPAAYRGEQIYADTLSSMKTSAGKAVMHFASQSNTVIGVVATNARMNKEDINKVAQMAQDGLARVIRPAHTMLDGDTIFSLSYGNLKANVNLIGACAAEAFMEAILVGVRTATPAGGLPACSLNSNNIR